MLIYITRRFLLLWPTLFGITALVFFVMGMSPGGIGGPLLDKFGNLKSEEAARVREYYNKRYGIDQPLIVQYGRWLNQISPIGKEIDDAGRSRFGLKWPSLGESMDRHRPVLDLIRESLPVTLLLNLISIPVVYAIGISPASARARNRGRGFLTRRRAAFSQLAAVVNSDDLGRRDVDRLFCKSRVFQMVPDVRAGHG